MTVLSDPYPTMWLMGFLILVWIPFIALIGMKFAQAEAREPRCLEWSKLNGGVRCRLVKGHWGQHDARVVWG